MRRSLWYLPPHGLIICPVSYVFFWQNGGIRVDGRKLLIVAAVSREDAVKIKANKTKVETGSRNLYLAREGCM